MQENLRDFRFDNLSWHVVKVTQFSAITLSLTALKSSKALAIMCHGYFYVKHTGSEYAGSFMQESQSFCLSCKGGGVLSSLFTF